jgi:hypothetical protein
MATTFICLPPLFLGRVLEGVTGAVELPLCFRTACKSAVPTCTKWSENECNFVTFFGSMLIFSRKQKEPLIGSKMGTDVQKSKFVQSEKSKKKRAGRGKTGGAALLIGQADILGYEC